MPKERVVYTDRWFWNAADRFLRDLLRSIAFGLIMFFSLVFLVFPLVVFSWRSSGADIEEAHPSLALFFGCLCVGLPAAVACWWAALKVAEDSCWEDPRPTIWDDQPVRWLESTVRFAHYLESQGRPIDMSLVLSQDVRAAAHRLIEQTDEVMVRAMLAAWLAASSSCETQMAAANRSQAERQRRLLGP